MADNVALPAASGTVAADEVPFSGDTALVQLLRPVHVEGSEGSKTLYDLTGQQGMFVVPRADTKRIAVTSTGLTTATTAYTAGDTLGQEFELADAARASGGTGRIVGVVLLDEQDVIGAVDVVFTRASVTLAANNAAWAISDADAANVIACVPLSVVDIGNNRIAQASNLSIPYDCSGGTSLFCSLITRTGHTFFSGGVGSLKLQVYVERD